MKHTIYLDNAATTPVDIAVAAEVQKFFISDYGNPSSLHHCGKRTKEELEKAREKIALFISAKPEEIIFTSGGTESNNLAMIGLAKANPNKKHIITSKIEHPSILETCKVLEKNGYKIDYIDVNSGGIINLNELKEKIDEKTLVVSIMHVNNEIGTIQPIGKIGEICSEKKVYFHSDCVQSFRKLDIDVKKMKLDLISISGHKINAPKGIGFLYIKKGTKISPIINGGGQEDNMRSGTENVPGIIGLAKALDVQKDKKTITEIRDKILTELLKIPSTKLNGSKNEKARMYDNINLSFYGIEGEGLTMLLDEKGICVSTGSACSSKKLEESHVLKAIGVEDLYIHGSLRLTLDKITEDEANFVINEIKNAVKKLRKLSPFKLNNGGGK